MPPGAASRRSRSWRRPGFAGWLERQRLENILQAVIDDDFLLQAGQNRLHRFEIKTATSHLRRFAIFGEQQREFLRLASGFIYAAEGIRFGLLLSFLRLTARVRNGV